jgi:hypothetical protein
MRVKQSQDQFGSFPTLPHDVGQNKIDRMVRSNDVQGRLPVFEEDDSWFELGAADSLILHPDWAACMLHVNRPERAAKEERIYQ